MAELDIRRIAGRRHHLAAKHGEPAQYGDYSRPHRLRNLELDILRPLPQHHLTQRHQILVPLHDCEKMVARQLTHFAGELDAAIGEQDLGFGNPTRVQQELARRRITGVVLERQAKV
jgi:hypothetical protein